MSEIMKWVNVGTFNARNSWDKMMKKNHSTQMRSNMVFKDFELTVSHLMEEKT